MWHSSTSWKCAVKVVSQVTGRIRAIPMIIVIFFYVSDKCQQNLKVLAISCGLFIIVLWMSVVNDEPLVTRLIGRRSTVELRRLRLVLMGCCWMPQMSGGLPGPRDILARQSCLLSCQASFSVCCCYSFPMNCSFLMSALDDSCGYDFCLMPMLNNSQARQSQDKVLTGGGDLREAQVDVPLYISHSCV